MHEYKVSIIKIVDGDTVDVDIDLGFGMWLKKERVRIMGIDTPESRTSDKIEKVFGMLAKARLSSLLGTEAVLQTQVSKKGVDMKGKFGRILGNFIVDYKGGTDSCANILMREGHAVEYTGGSKEAVQTKHLENRKKLIIENKNLPGGANWRQFGDSLSEALVNVTPPGIKPSVEIPGIGTITTTSKSFQETTGVTTSNVKGVSTVIDANDSPIVKPEPVKKKATKKKTTAKKK